MTNEEPPVDLDFSLLMGDKPIRMRFSDTQIYDVYLDFSPVLLDKIVRWAQGLADAEENESADQAIRYCAQVLKISREEAAAIGPLARGRLLAFLAQGRLPTVIATKLYAQPSASPAESSSAT